MEAFGFCLWAAFIIDTLEKRLEKGPTFSQLSCLNFSILLPFRIQKVTLCSRHLREGFTWGAVGGDSVICMLRW